MTKPTKPAAVDGPTLDDAADAQLFSSKTFAWVEYTPLAVQFMADSNDYVELAAAEVDADAMATEAGRAQAVERAAAAEHAATQAALSAAASAGNGIDASEAAHGATLQVDDDGAGTKILTLSSGQRGHVQTDLVGVNPSLDLSRYQIFPILLTGTTTFEFDLSGFGSMVGSEITFMVVIEQGGTAYGVDWTNGATQVIKSDNDTLPDLPIANQKGYFIISSIDAGATWTIARTMRFST